MLPNTAGQSRGRHHVDMPNIERPDFDDVRGDQPGFRQRRARIGRQLGCERLGASIFELPPGEAAYPYHWHVAEEELIVVLSGRPSLRTPEGWREVAPGEVLSFLVGERGGHQLVNRSEETVRFLSISTMADGEIVVYPDSNKLGAYGRGPGGLRELFVRDSAVDYFEGEEPPG
jgi:uncharacterized cupin superfamily protein